MRKPAYVLGVILICFLSLRDSEARDADLLNIRFGWHNTFARVVFDFDGKVTYQVDGDSTCGEIYIEFFRASLSGLSQIDFGRLNGGMIDSLHVQNLGENRVTAEITPKGNFTLRSFHFSRGRPIGRENPFKVVVDVYRCSEGSPRSRDEIIVGHSNNDNLNLRSGDDEVGPTRGEIVKIESPHNSGSVGKIIGALKQPDISTVLHYIRGDLKTRLAIPILCTVAFLTYQFMKKRPKKRRGAKVRRVFKQPLLPDNKHRSHRGENVRIGVVDRVQNLPQDQSKDTLSRRRKYELAGQLAAGGWNGRDIAKELQMGQREVELLNYLTPRMGSKN